MKQRMIGILALLFMLMTTGCEMEVDMKVKLNADGSGIYEQKMQFSGKMKDMLTNTDSPLPDSLASQIADSTIVPERSMKQKCEDEDGSAEALKLGEGVRFSGVVFGETDDAISCTKIFTFQDINTFRLISDIPLENNDSPVPKEPIRFRYRNNQLTITMPPRNDSRNNAISTNDVTRESMEMIEAITGHFKLNMRIEMPRSIRTTNAQFKTRNTITLVDIDMAKVFEGKTFAQKKAFFTNMDKITRSNQSEAQKARSMNTLTPLKFEPNKVVNVTF